MYISVVIKPVAVVRDLGVWLDNELSLRQHVAKVASARFYQLRRLRQIRRRAGCEVTTRLVLALVTSRLDYCNSLLSDYQTVHRTFCRGLKMHQLV